MTLAALYQNIRERFRANVQATHATELPVYYGNTFAADDAGDEVLPPPTGVHCRVSTLVGDAFQPVTASRSRYPGLMVVQIFNPVDQGNDSYLTIADAINAAFRSQRDGNGILWFVPRGPNEAGRDGQLTQWNVECPFEFDEVF